MSQKFVKIKNNNKNNAKTYGKYYAKAVYDNHFVGTDEIADFIQSQASVKKSDIKAVLQELGEAMKHFFEMGQKIKLEGPENQAGGHRNPEGRFLEHRCKQARGLHREHHHHPSCAVSARV